MAVIVSGLKYPVGCKDCKFRCGDVDTLVGAYCELIFPGGYVLKDDWENRRGDCPLKSVEGLIDHLRITGTSYIYEQDVFKVIREYCGEGNNG